MARVEDDAELLILRSYELRLICCTLLPTHHQFPNSSHDHHLHSYIRELLTFIEKGQYIQALSSNATRLVFNLTEDDSPNSYDDSIECADRVYSEMLDRLVSFVVNDSEDDKDMARRVMLVLCVSIAAILSFIQCNLTGPLEDLPKCPLPLKISTCNELIKWDEWARNQLLSAGSHLLSKFSNLQYIVFARMLLMKARDMLFEGITNPLYEIKSISWWLARILFIQQGILDERSSSLFDLLQVLKSENLNNFGTLENVTGYWGAVLFDKEASTVVSAVHLEFGIMEHNYGRIDSCRKHFESAEVASGLNLSVTGVLGFRTIHQVDPKAQLVLVAKTTTSNSCDTCPSTSPDMPTPGSNVAEDTLHLQQSEFDASDILKIPKLLENGNNSETRAEGIHNGNTHAPLNSTQQAVILAQCLLIEKGTRCDEMQRWDMAPYIEAIDSQPFSYFLIRCFCSILRIRWESTRSHTKERALLMMDKLVQSLREPSPGVSRRIFFCFGVCLPTISALRKEYGELLVRCGLIGEAVKLFEDLELWDNLIHCYCLMEKKAAAVELIKQRLLEMPTDPKLWCSLGDVTNNDSCYEKAMEVSGDRSARAKRSLARSAYNRGDYEKSKILWEAAMAMNSLYPDGWFALGAAALKARDVEKALDGFTRAVQLDPDNGEAWNNIACLHMIKKRSKEAFIAFKEALKFKRNSWQLWENYSHVALDVGNISQALEATRMVLDMTNNKRTDAELLERIMSEIERRPSTIANLSPSTDGNNSTAHSRPAESTIISDGETTLANSGVRSRETEQLIEFLGKILQRVVRSVGGAEMWGLYARWLKTKGDLTMCSEALLKQVRLYQGSDLWKDEERFKKFAHASLELCKVYMDISSTNGSQRELLSAEMHLRNILKQAESFSTIQEFMDLRDCHAEVKEKIASHRVST